MSGMRRNGVSNSVPSRRCGWRAVASWTLVVVLCAVVVEGGAYLVLRLAYGPVTDEADRLNRFDPELGWTNIPERRFVDRYGPGAHASHNSDGFRALRDYALEVPEGIFRVAILGDSFTYGICGDEATFAAQLERKEDGLEVINMGIPGYGLDQMHLFYLREGSRYATDLLVVAIIEDDIDRMRSTVFLTRYGKPRLEMRDGRLVPGNVPLPDWRDPEADGWIGGFPRRTATRLVVSSVLARVNRYEDARPLAAEVLKDLQSLSAIRQQEFVVLYLPSSFRGARDFAPSAAGSESLVTWLKELAEREGIRFWDASPAFRGLPESRLRESFRPDQHYSEEGNRVVAGLLHERVRNLRGTVTP